MIEFERQMISLSASINFKYDCQAHIVFIHRNRII